MEKLISELRIILSGIRGAARSGGRLIRKAPPRFWLFWCLFLVSGMVLLILLNLVPKVVYADRMSASKQNLHAVQLALERFACDSPGGTYPARIEQLIEDGYLPALPRNPFTGQPMRWGVYGSFDAARKNPDLLNHGDFGYIPAREYRRGLQQEDLSSLSTEDIESYNLILY